MSLQALTISVVMTDEYILRWLLTALNNTVGNDILFVPACDRKRLTTLYIHLVSYRTADELCSGASMSNVRRNGRKHFAGVMFQVT